MRRPKGWTFVEAADVAYRLRKGQCCLLRRPAADRRTAPTLPRRRADINAGTAAHDGNCSKVLSANSLEARICTYECTFCAACVDGVLRNVCPNCGGGFVPRPIRPARNWKGDNYLGKDPASTKIRHRPVDPVAHARFAATLQDIAPRDR